MNMHMLTNAYAKVRKPLRKTVSGVKRQARRTFKKLFGEAKGKSTEKKRRSRYEANSKFITDKMLSETSDTDSGYDTPARRSSTLDASTSST